MTYWESLILTKGQHTYSHSQNMYMIPKLMANLSNLIQQRSPCRSEIVLCYRGPETWTPKLGETTVSMSQCNIYWWNHKTSISIKLYKSHKYWKYPTAENTFDKNLTMLLIAYMPSKNYRTHTKTSYHWGLLFISYSKYN